MTIVVHGDINLMGVDPQATEIDALVYMWGGKILRLLANTALLCRKRHKIGKCLLWRIYRKSQAIYRTAALPMTFSDP